MFVSNSDFEILQTSKNGNGNKNVLRKYRLYSLVEIIRLVGVFLSIIIQSVRLESESFCFVSLTEPIIDSRIKLVDWNFFIF